MDPLEYGFNINSGLNCTFKFRYVNIMIRLGVDAMNVRRGGSVTHLVELFKAASPVSHGISEVVVWTNSRTSSLLPRKPWLKVVVDEMPNQSLFSWIKWQKTFLSLKSLHHCDLLFIPGGLYLGSFQPYVTMSRNLLPFDINERKRFGWTRTRLRYHLLEKAQSATFRRASGVIFLTRNAQQVTERRIGPLSARTVIIPHGVSDAFRREPRKARRISEINHSKPFRWLYVSIVNWYKHQWNVAEAVVHLKAEGYPIRLDLVGPAYGPALSHLKKILNKIDPEGSVVQYHGHVPYENLADLYKKADAFVFASTCETFGQILVEAMNSGMPIACSNKSAMPELLGDAGLYFDPENVESIVSVLRKYMDDPDLREQLSYAAYEQAKMFDWKKCSERTFSFVEEIVRHYKL